MFKKSLKLDSKVVKNLELVVKGLNEKAGTDVYDFSSVLKIAINQYLKSEEIKEIIEFSRQRKFSNSRELLLASESSLRKDWHRPEEDRAWRDL